MKNGDLKTHANKIFSSGKYFTIIELLVVIAIISILMAMLLPALKGARDQAKKIGCLNLLKQYGLSTMSYVSDFQEHAPSVYDGSFPGGQQCWQERAELKDALKGLYTVANGWERCPARPETKYGNGQNDRLNIVPVTYSGLSYPCLRTLRKPSTTIFWCDSARYPAVAALPTQCYYHANQYQPTDGAWASTMAGVLIPAYHGNNFNVWYWDGHSDFLSRFRTDNEQRDLFKWK